jgi:hypothetical protein
MSFAGSSFQPPAPAARCGNRVHVRSDQAEPVHCGHCDCHRQARSQSCLPGSTEWVEKQCPDCSGGHLRVALFCLQSSRLCRSHLSSPSTVARQETSEAAKPPNQRVAILAKIAEAMPVFATSQPANHRFRLPAPAGAQAHEQAGQRQGGARRRHAAQLRDGQGAAPAKVASPGSTSSQLSLS